MREKNCEGCANLTIINAKYKDGVGVDKTPWQRHSYVRLFEF